MPTFSKLSWIQTRDGSPTLWSNEKGESFRSVRGAWTESWNAFVGPALDKGKELVEVGVGEFGLGAGTNWILWQSAVSVLGLKSDYWVIEKDLESFSMGLAQWSQLAPQIAAFLVKQGISANVSDVERAVNEQKEIRIFPSLGAAVKSSPKCDIWFHDPFGFDVNPEGYSEETIQACSKFWKPGARGFSYACNKRFQRLLQRAGAHVELKSSLEVGLKRERLEFSVP